MIKIDITDKWDKERVRRLIATNDKAVIRGLLALYKRQLPEEKEYASANVENGVGFNRLDTPYLTEMSKKIIEGGGADQKDIDFIRVRLMKYSGQLADIANSKDKQLEWKL